MDGGQSEGRGDVSPNGSYIGFAGSIEANNAAMFDGKSKRRALFSAEPFDLSSVGREFE